MTLANVAWKNVSRSFRSYFLYLASIAFNVFVFYLFSSARHDPTVDGVINAKAAFGIGMLVASTIIAAFSAVFMWYSTSFFLRRRSREIGLYGLFGVPKPVVSAMFFAENMLAGAGALVAGLAVGIPFSKLFMMALLRIMDLDTAVTLNVSPAALAETGIVFASLMAVASLAAAWRVFRFRLADTFRAEKAAERRPKGALALGAASIAVISAGYAISAFTTGRNLIINFFIVSGITILGTWGFARGGGAFVMGLLKRSPAFSSSGPRLIASSDLSFRIGSNSRVFFAIAMVSTVSMVALGVGLNLKAATLNQMNEFSTFTMSYSGSFPPEEARAALEGAGATVTAQAKARIMHARCLKEETSQGIEKTSPRLPARAMIVSGADYLSFLPASKRRETSKALDALPPRSFAVIQPYDLLADYVMEGGFRLVFSGRNGDTEIQAEAGLRLEHPGIMLPLGQLTLIAPEAEFSDLSAAFPESADTQFGIRIADERRGNPAAEALKAKLGPESDFFSVTSWQEIIKIYDMAFFVGILIGSVFLISSCSILHFKQLMDAADDAKRHETLFKIGLSSEDAKKLAFLEVFPMYALPLGLACVHSVVALSVMGRVLEDNFSFQICCVVVAFSLTFAGAGMLTTRSCLALMKRSAPATG